MQLAFQKVNLGSLKAAVFQIDSLQAFASILCYIVLMMAVEAGRLWSAGRMLKEHQPGFFSWVRMFSETRPFLYLLPASVGTEGMLWVRLRQSAWNHISCGFVLFLTRMVGMGMWACAAGCALSGATGIGTALPASMFRSPMIWWIGGITTLVASAFLPLLLEHYRGLVLRDGAMGAFLTLQVLSLGSLVLNTGLVFWAGRAAHIPISPLTALGLLALLNFAMVLPISIGGFGLQETLVIAVGVPLGFAVPALLAFSTLIHAQRLGLILTGLPFFLSTKALGVKHDF